MAETFLFEIVTPMRQTLSQPVELVVVPGGDGNFGVLPEHAPMLATLRPGTIEIRDKNLKILDRIFIEGGFVEVTPERCTILAEESVPVRQITRDDAEERVKRAHDSLMVADTFGVRMTAERDLRAAEAMLEAVEEFEKTGGA
jgi:F-type H+-transporting ATPase subunit epsilon